MCVVSDFPLFQTPDPVHVRILWLLFSSFWFYLLPGSVFISYYRGILANKTEFLLQKKVISFLLNLCFSIASCIYENIFMTNCKECKIRLKLLKQNSPNSINVRWGGIAGSKENLQCQYTSYKFYSIYPPLYTFCSFLYKKEKWYKRNYTVLYFLRYTVPPSQKGIAFLFWFNNSVALYISQQWMKMYWDEETAFECWKGAWIGWSWCWKKTLKGGGCGNLNRAIF